MPKSDITALRTAIKREWPNKPSAKAKRYIGSFSNSTRTGRKITAQVEGHHGTYTVSVQTDDKGLSSACSCYIGAGGFCHHCQALALTFLQDQEAFTEVNPAKRENIQDLQDVRAYLRDVTLDSLLKQLSAQGITQKALAESMGMNPRHLSAIKSSELRNRYFNELGATKLACLWVLEHSKNIKTK